MSDNTNDQEAVQAFQDSDTAYRQDHIPEEKGHNQQDMEDPDFDPQAEEDAQEIKSMPSGQVEPEAAPG